MPILENMLTIKSVERVVICGQTDAAMTDISEMMLSNVYLMLRHGKGRLSYPDGK